MNICCSGFGVFVGGGYWGYRVVIALYCIGLLCIFYCIVLEDIIVLYCIGAYYYRVIENQE